MLSRALESQDRSEGGLASGLRELWLELQADQLRPVSEDPSELEFEIAEGEALGSVAQRLESSGLLRDAAAFRLLARVQGRDKQIQAGRHRLRRNMAAAELLDALMVAPADEVRVTIREGLRLEEVAELLGGSGIATRQAVVERAQQPLGLEHPVLAFVPEGASLEGYLFPDTYAFDAEATAESAILRLLDGFEDRAGDALRAADGRFDLSLHELVTLASIVEREAVLEVERPRIARVFHNRLETAPFLLNADPTIQYGLGFQPESQTWWKRPLLYADLELDSPYNSYRIPGLPPSPIASPGLASIEATLAPEPGSWQYFVVDGIACDGSHVFADTLAEHAANVERYQVADCIGP